MLRKNRHIIALLTDFGHRNWYTSAIKGAILSISSEVNIVDISHDVPRQDVQTGAYILNFVSRYYPKDAIFLCVVDPGVGTERSLVVLETKAGHLLVAPDNGLLSLVASREGVRKIVEIKNKRYMLSEVSQTFHGRDIMAPVAAHLANGEPIESFGPEIKRIKLLELKKPIVEGRTIKGKIIFIDDFGNVITNIEGSILEEIGSTLGVKIRVTLGSSNAVVTLLQTYADVKASAPLGLVGSDNLFELAVNRGDAAKRYGASTGMDIAVESV
jgi:S-adenosyl-L-methionine hydrolase (adenosine-forming)